LGEGGEERHFVIEVRPRLRGVEHEDAEEAVLVHDGEAEERHTPMPLGVVGVPKAQVLAHVGHREWESRCRHVSRQALADWDGKVLLGFHGKPDTDPEAKESRVVL
jgi:hypothetical protein